MEDRGNQGRRFPLLPRAATLTDMLMVLDIGNTNITAGVFDGAELIGHWRIATAHDLTGDHLAVLLREMFAFKQLDFAAIDGIAVANVVPPLQLSVLHLSRAYFNCEPLVVGPGVKTGMAIEYEDPREVGADRIVNGLAAFTEYGGPIIIVDFGTGTTLDAVSEDGSYLGGAIAPGIQISLDALFHHAAQLRRVELVRPKKAIGRNTVWSMQSGIIFGYSGLVKELIRKFKEEMGEDTKVIATGGLASLIGSEVSDISAVDPWLTLKGLRIIWERNRE